MTDIIFSLYQTRPSLFIGGLGLLFLIVFFLCSIFLYVYINIHIKKIYKIIVNDEKWYKAPLSLLTFHFLSALPIVFWKEYLNIKRNIRFKKLYSKNYYFPLNKNNLSLLIKEYPVLFYMQYFIFWDSVYIVDSYRI